MNRGLVIFSYAVLAVSIPVLFVISTFDGAQPFEHKLTALIITVTLTLLVNGFLLAGLWAVVELMRIRRKRELQSAVVQAQTLRPYDEHLMWRQGNLKRATFGQREQYDYSAPQCPPLESNVVPFSGDARRLNQGHRTSAVPRSTIAGMSKPS